MLIPPSMLKGSEPEYRRGPFDSTKKSTEVTFLHDLADWLWRIRQLSTIEPTEVAVSHFLRERQQNQSWPVIEFAVSRARLWQEIWVLVVAIAVGLVLIFADTDSATRSKLLLLMSFCLFLLPQTLKALARALVTDWRGSVCLESDCLVFDPGLAQAPHSVRYEQIWNVDVSKDNRVVYIKYYPARFDGQIDEGRAAAMSLNYVQDTGGLANELGRRTYGVPPRQYVEVKYAIINLLRSLARLFLLGVVWFTTMAIFSILFALRSWRFTG